MGYNGTLLKAETVLSVHGMGIDGEKLKTLKLEPAETAEVLEASKKFILERKKIEPRPPSRGL